MTEKSRKRKNRSGPGRPPVFDDPVYTAFWMEREDKERLYEQKGTLPVGVYVGMLLRSKNAEKAILMREIAEKDEEIKALKKENEELKRLVERLQERIEKLELENQALKQGRSVRSYQDALKLKELAKHAREGISWKALCAEVLGLRSEKKIKDLLKLAFVVKKDDHNRFPDKFYPKDIAEEFHGWVLKRPNTKTFILI